ncbi:hypothetical protein POTOM_033546 [Populus tomentosa]|uniref:Uncharacterized protein n=1 Tax=Populus tomentosa TaxID=118781 RepID=A0A8X7Z292_POPTO|nr:hypothetical protein POTOM_033546 [Populus tomentosa]
MTCNENPRKLKNKTTQFCKQREGFRNLSGHQLQEIEIEVKGKGHQVGVVENLLKIAKGSKKMIIISSKANLKSLSKTADYSSSKPSILSVFSPKTAVPNATCSLHRRDHHSSVDKSSDEANVGLLRDNEKAKILLLFCYNSIAIGSDDNSSDFRFLQMVNATKGLFISCLRLSCNANQSLLANGTKYPQAISVLSRSLLKGGVEVKIQIEVSLFDQVSCSLESLP